MSMNASMDGSGNGDEVLDQRRILPLQGACNFRDIGGYEARDGSTVHWGRIYRAGVLSYLGEDDQDELHTLQVRAICDLRRTAERRLEPTRWPTARDRPRELYWEDGPDAPAIHDFTSRRPHTAAGMFDAMVELYRALPAWMSSRIGGLFACIANDQVPLIIHCAAGKDRTGIAVAVLLGSLGVPWETVLEDYLLTNQAGNFEAFMNARRNTMLGLSDSEHPLLAMPSSLRRVLFSADAVFLQAAKDEIDNRYGGLDAYLERTAGVTAKLQERVRRILLNPHGGPGDRFGRST